MPPYPAWRSPTAHDPLPHQAKYSAGATMRLRTQGLPLCFLGVLGSAMCSQVPGSRGTRVRRAPHNQARRLITLSLSLCRGKRCRSSRSGGLDLNSGPENAWRKKQLADRMSPEPGMCSTTPNVSPFSSLRLGLSHTASSPPQRRGGFSPPIALVGSHDMTTSGGLG